MWRQSLAWSPTIALSWLWGLGFFYAIHVTFLYGWPGFVAFAVPNALGLVLFGCAVEWFGPRGPLDDSFGRLAARYGGILFAYQVAAVGVTLFAFAADYLRPLVGGLAIPLAVLLAVAASTVGHVARVQDFRALHAAMLVAGVACALAALLLMPVAGPVHVAAGPDGRFYGLVVPSLVGFLLGPWLDLQHWQRVLRIRHEGASAARAYAAAGLLFLALLTLNALFAAALPQGTAAALHRGFDGVAEAPAALATALAAMGPAASATAWLFGVWAAIAVASTLDSAYAATRWFLVAATTRSTSPVFALLPAALVQTPLWMLLAALGLSGAAYAANAPLLLLMAPFATLFVGYSACLVLQVTRRAGPHDSMLCFLLGIAASACFAVGYYAQLVPVMAVSPLLPLLAAAPLLTGPPSAATAAASRDATEQADPQTRAPPGPARPAGAHGFAAAPGQTAAAEGGVAVGAAPLMGRFDGAWFQYDVIPTYDDTNSVGNVYFANYVRWVGKTRELFFARCVPNFDLKTTGFFILTRDFYHKFVRETREFEAILVRIRVGKNNRKFVTLEHEIRSADGGLLGKGSQQLMFVDSASYQLIDVPVDMLRGFLPYVTNVGADIAAQVAS
jgi:acyl-CoA thioesterase FadM